MLDIKWIRENPDALDRALATRGAPPAAASLIALDDARRSHIVALEAAQARRNAASKEIGRAKAAGDEETARRLMAEVTEIKTFLQSAEAEGRARDKALEDALAVVPNLPLGDVPVGADERANVVARSWGRKPGLNHAREHFEIGEALGQMDFAAAAKLSGSRFVVLRKDLARLSRALGQFMLDLHTNEHGYEEVVPPLLVRDEVLLGTGQLPKFKEDQFQAWRTTTLEERLQWHDRRAEAERAETGSRDMIVRDVDEAPPLDRLWLIPTAEVPLTNLVRKSILDEADLPLRYTALTPCFRSEAGAAGKDTRGMLRQHQFDKVELVSVTTPERSEDELERMLACAEEVLRRLDLHYRVVVLSTGDMGFAARKTYDIEVWLPGQGTYREISSCSVCGDFQARRMRARYRPSPAAGRQGRAAATAPRLVHTLNGSGVAVGRALIAVLENYQDQDGSVAVPDVLKPYMGGLEKIGNAHPHHQ